MEPFPNPGKMLRDIEHNGQTFTVIKENHVIGILSD